MCYNVWKSRTIVPVKHCGIVSRCFYLACGTAAVSTRPWQVDENLDPAKPCCSTGLVQNCSRRLGQPVGWYQPHYSDLAAPPNSRTSSSRDKEPVHISHQNTFRPKPHHESGLHNAESQRKRVSFAVVLRLDLWGGGSLCKTNLC